MITEATHQTRKIIKDIYNDWKKQAIVSLCKRSGTTAESTITQPKLFQLLGNKTFDSLSGQWQSTAVAIKEPQPSLRYEVSLYGSNNEILEQTLVALGRYSGWYSCLVLWALAEYKSDALQTTLQGIVFMTFKAITVHFSNKIILQQPDAFSGSSLIQMMYWYV